MSASETVNRSSAVAQQSQSAYVYGKHKLDERRGNGISSPVVET